ncbi:hypothetical protein Ancab_008995 [Ancistrocladus abbreviatus]
MKANPSLDIFVYELAKSYIRATPLRRDALKALLRNEIDMMKVATVFKVMTSFFEQEGNRMFSIEELAKLCSFLVFEKYGLVARLCLFRKSQEIGDEAAGSNIGCRNGGVWLGNF